MMNLVMCSSPAMLGRPSSPLNPSHASSSSSPLSSPTPLPSYNITRTVRLPLTSTSSRHATRYKRPGEAQRGLSNTSSQNDLFGGGGSTPLEGAMWRERFTRRAEERERRKQLRDDEIARRRSLTDPHPTPVRNQPLGDFMNQEESDQKAQADDEEVCSLSCAAFIALSPVDISTLDYNPTESSETCSPRIARAGDRRIRARIT